MNRRHFLQLCAAFPCALSIPVYADDAVSFAAGLQKAFDALDFQPEKGKREFFVTAADIHYTEDQNHDQNRAFRFLIHELNTLPEDLLPDHLMVLGDCICSMSPCFSYGPNVPKALKEYANLHEDLAVLNPKIPVRVIAGNHDTPPFDEESEVFCREMKTPPYYRYECAGLPILALDGGHDGFLGKKQRAWLKEETAKLQPERNVAILIHQPMGFTNERGLAETLPDALKNQTGEVYVLAGHEHHDATAYFQLPKTRLTQWTHIRTGGAGFSSHGGPSWWVYCVEDGRITARIQRCMDGQIVAHRIVAPDEKSLRPIIAPFSQVQEKCVVRALLGEDETYELVTCKGGNCGSYFFYLKSATFKIHVPAGANPSKMAVLGNLNSGFNGTPKPEVDRKRHVFLSSDGENWDEVPFGERTKDFLYWLEIPEKFRSVTDLFVRVDAPGMAANDVLAGFGLYE